MESAKPCGVSLMKQLMPFWAVRPAAPREVVTTGRPVAIASRILMRRPEPRRMGLMKTVACLR